MNPKPTIPQGTRDFNAAVLRKRNYIFNTIRNVFALYGFEPLETPAMENLETLLGKYGDEGDKLIFKILNNGLDHPDKKKKAKEDFEKILEGKNQVSITERALKYDLTIPFARYVAMNHKTLSFPFKRYQVQPVWRADRPQKGRYREFYQCDADVVGSRSLMYELEFANIYHAVFTDLRITGYELHINHRGILSALAELSGGKMNDIAIAIDKLEKTGWEKVREELMQKGLKDGQLASIEKYLHIKGSNEEKLAQLEIILGNTQTGMKGLEELKSLLAACKAPLSVDLTLARGLNYYTGTIFEAKAPSAVKIGSIGGGGRYDDLTGLFGVPGIPGVGISFGVDRIYDVMEELKLFPEETGLGTQVLFFNLGEKESKRSYELMQTLRSRGTRCELYHEQSKLDRQFKYAENKKIPWVIIIGEKERMDKSCNIKNLSTGKQETILAKDLGLYKF
jgi:histidyl-tRNA synthetase